MSIVNLIKTSIYSLKSHKLRVFLTMIGIIIGISSVIVILSIGNGLKVQVSKSAEDTSANKINISFQPENPQADLRLLEPFNKTDTFSLQKIDGVEKIESSKDMFSGFSFTSAQASYFDKKASILLESYENKTLNLEYGREFGSNENFNNLIVLNNDTAKQLFDDPKTAIGHGITFNGLIYEVIGVLKKNSDFSMEGNFSYISEQSKKQLISNDAILSLDVYVKPNADKTSVFKNLKENLELSHPNIKGEYKLQDPQALTKAFESIIGGLTAFVALVTGISLFVGGIGVMNIMYVSVSERKREIGIRRAIGAKPKSILLQFLFEAILVTGIGGIIGILLGYLCGKLLGVFLPFKPILSSSSLFSATVTSVLVGIVFGIIPAYNASKLEPIKAIYK
jgi:putative ABC transport system permease protein